MNSDCVRKDWSKVGNPLTFNAACEMAKSAEKQIQLMNTEVHSINAPKGYQRLKNQRQNPNKSRLSLIVWVNVVLNRTVVVHNEWRFDNLCGSHLQSQSQLYYVSRWYYILVVDLIGQLRRDVIGRLQLSHDVIGNKDS